jgi:hypothetical protein
MAAVRLWAPWLACLVALGAAEIEFGLYDFQLDPGGGWRLMDGADFAAHRLAFIAHYNAHGLRPLRTFTTGNCCFAVKGGDKLFLSGSPFGYQFPVDSKGALQCSPRSGYQQDEAYRFYRMPKIGAAQSFRAAPACVTNHNPAVFMRGSSSGATTHSAGAVAFAMYDFQLEPSGGWLVASSADLMQYHREFVEQYNGNGGLGVVQNFQSGNCCFAVRGGMKLIISGTTYGYQFPAATSGGIRCNPTGGYTDKAYQFYRAPKLSMAQQFTEKAACATSHNPAVFIRVEETVQAKSIEFGLYDRELVPTGGWVLMAPADLEMHKEQFVETYNKHKGVAPIQPFQSGNCCVAVKSGYMLTISGTPYGYQFPASRSGDIRCNPSAGYNEPSYLFYRAPSLAATQTYGEKRACATSHNPALFMREAGAAVPTPQPTPAPTPSPTPEAVHCKVSLWGRWSLCSQTCGRGTASRVRTVDAESQHGGTACPTLGEIKPCLEQDCPVHCQTSSWGAWGACNAQCGTGARTRTRSVVVVPLYTGNACPHLSDDIPCATLPCPVHCEVTAFSGWSECDAVCGTGSRERKRMVIVPPLFDGSKCPALSERRPCATRSCYCGAHAAQGSQPCRPPTPCTASEWQVQAPTLTSDRTCVALAMCKYGQYETVRPTATSNRACADHALACLATQWEVQSPTPTMDRVCREHTICTTTEWQNRTAGPFKDRACSPTTLCRTSQWEVQPPTATRDRWCHEHTRCHSNLEWQSAPGTAHANTRCTQLTRCAPTEWQVVAPSPTSDRACRNHTACTATEWEVVAASGSHDRLCVPHSACSRSEWMSNPAGTHNDIDCHTLTVCERTQYETSAATATSDRVCAAHTSCTAKQWEVTAARADKDRVCRDYTTCEVGEHESKAPTRSSDRECTLSPVHCQVSSWSAWSGCTKTCGAGVQSRARAVEIQPMHNGDACPPIDDTRICATQVCPIDCEVSRWTAWTGCSISCGAGVQFKTRSVAIAVQFGGKPCAALTAMQACSDGKCPVHCDTSSWTAWSTCSKSCGTGMQSRSRSVVTHAAHGGYVCPPLAELRSCATDACPVHCDTSSWTAWSTCSKSCGTGMQSRSRSVVTHAAHGGYVCPPLAELRSCATDACPVDCVLSRWSAWSACSKTCGAGVQTKSRTVATAVQDGGKACDALSAVQACTDGRCPVHCDVSSWNSWSTCTKTCGVGMQSRSRSVKMHAMHGGYTCPLLAEVRVCVLVACPMNCEVSTWGRWGACSVTCGAGTARRSRSIIVPARFRGNACPALSDVQSCSPAPRPCPVRCTANQWLAELPSETSAGRCEMLTVCARTHWEEQAATLTSDRRCTALVQCSDTQWESAPATSTSDRKCAEHSTCSALEWETNPADTHSDRECRALTTCSSSQWQSTAASAERDRVCTEVTTCTVSQWQTRAPSSDFDRVCAQATICGTNEYEVTPATFSSDRICASHTVCTESQWQSVPASLSQDRRCTAVATCAPAQWQAAPATTTSDRVCRDLTQCSGTEWQSSPPDSYRDRICTAVTKCGEMQFQSSAPTAAADRVCRIHSGACTQGEWQARTPSAFHDRVCHVLTTCSAEEWEEAEPTASTDRQCTPLTTCTALAWESTAAGPRNDRQCSALTDCNDMQWESASAGPQNDRTCYAVRTCSEHQFQSQAPTRFRNRSCQDATVCLGSEYQVQAPTAYRDRICASHTACTDTQWESRAPALDRDRECSSISSCSSEQWESQPPTKTSNRVCDDRTTCGPTKWVVTEGSPTEDRRCREYATCSTMEWESVPAAAASDRVCTALTICSSLEWESEQPDSHHDRECTALTTCAASQWEADAPTGSSDRECRDHTVCDAQQWEATEPTKLRDRHCRALSTCAPLQWESAAATATSDRACTDATTCSRLQWEAHSPTLHSDRVCQQTSVCTADEFESQPPTLAADRMCSQLTVCPKGRFVSITAGTTTDRVCSTCPRGTFQGQTNQHTCNACSPGYFQAAAGQEVCGAVMQCKDHEYEIKPPSLTWNRVCASHSLCAASHFVSAMATARNDRHCSALTICTARQFEQKAPAYTTVPTAHGSVQQATSDRVCRTRGCPRGSFVTPSGLCTMCPAGKYKNCGLGCGWQACLACAKGEEATTAGMDFCTGCQPGYFASSVGRAMCSKCPSGRFATKHTSHLCDACPVGRFVATPGSVACPMCPAGSSQGTAGSSKCILCAAGYSSFGGEATCDECPQGSSSESGARSCFMCPAGKFSDESVAPFCTKCGAGRFSSDVGALSCKKCPAGQYTPDAEASSCLLCAPGTASRLSGEARCKRCPHGQYAYAGQAACTAHSTCPAGEFLSGFRENLPGICTPCATGRHKMGAQRFDATCVAHAACRAGWFRAHATPEHEGVCKECLEGQFKVEGLEASASHMCGMHAPCAAGEYRRGYSAASAGVCESCAKGHFKSTSLAYNETCAAQERCLAGHELLGQSTSSAGHCEPCAAGRFRSEAAMWTRCMVCVAGTFSSRDAATACTSCPAGQVQESSGKSRCHLCDVKRGQFQDFAGQRECKSVRRCAAGSQLVEHSASSGGHCSHCEPGTFKEDTGEVDQKCMACAEGRFSSAGASLCTECAKGTYQDMKGQLGCVPCVRGRFNAETGRTSELQCFSCPSGKFTAESGSASCTSCTKGFFLSDAVRAVEASAHCTMCPKGRFQERDGSIHCVACPSGKYQHMQGGELCHSCDIKKLPFTGGRLDDAHFFWTNNEAGHHSCTPHPADCQLSDWTTITPCTASCGTGTQTTQRTVLHEAWGAGKPCDQSRLARASDCNTQPCPVDCSISKWSAWSACSASCGGGMRTQTRSVLTDARFGGNACPALSRWTACNDHPCPVDCDRVWWGKWSQCTQACGGGRRTRTRVYKAQPKYGGKACPAKHDSMPCNSHCCAGAAYHGAALECVACPVGKFAGHTGHCQACPAGKFQSQAGKTKCAACTPGTFHNARGTAQNFSSRCSYCPNGKYQPSAGQLGCTQCSKGRYNPFRGRHAAASCMACHHGKFGDAIGMTSCKLCGVGQFQEGEGQSTCHSCAPGQYNPYFGRGSKGFCYFCPCGKWSMSQANVCVECAAGRYRHGKGGSRVQVCLPAVPGHFVPKPASCAQKTCQAGHYEDASGSPECKGCSAGTFSSGTAQAEASACKMCPRGKWAAEKAGAYSCASCPAGRMFVVQQGADYRVAMMNNCKLCPQGRAASQVASLACNACAAGRFASEYGSAECKLCGAGQFMPAMPHAMHANATRRVACKSCPPGMHQPVSGRAGCIACGKGMYQHEARQAKCVDCPAGRSSSLRGADALASCELCTKGRFASRPGMEACATCPAGRFGKLGPGARNEEWACEHCASGQYADTPGLAACKLCSAGTFAGNYHARLRCLRCPTGKYQEADGMPNCDSCRSGQITSYDHNKLHCHACSALDSVRKYDTGGLAGQSRCSPVPLDCAASAWTAFSSCTRTCGTGQQTRTRHPLRQPAEAACGLADQSLCSQGWGFGLKCSSINWKQTRPCGTAPCPQDCAAHPWGQWGSCSQSCGKGSTTRSRAVRTPATAGGKRCPALYAKGPCNDHSCRLLPVCHEKHVRCAVKAAMVVVHDRRHMRRAGQFSCSHDGASCACRCTSHAPCCVHERTVLGNDALFGNRYNGVARMQDCCNLCTNHPLCSSWEYDSRRRCVLKRGEPKLVPASSEAFLEGLTTWAGLSGGAHSATACPLDTASADAAMRTTATTELANRLVV